MFCNITELIIPIYALNYGMVRVVQHFLLGSILSKLLLVLGSAFFTRGTLDNRRAQVFTEVGDCYSDLISRVTFLNEICYSEIFCINFHISQSVELKLQTTVFLFFFFGAVIGGGAENCLGEYRNVVDGFYGNNVSYPSSFHKHRSLFWEVGVVTLKIQQLYNASDLHELPFLPTKISAEAESY